jgi:hypothetical protein
MLCQYLYFCTSKARKLRANSVGDGGMLPSLLSAVRKDVMYRDGDQSEAKLLCKPVALFVARVQVCVCVCVCVHTHTQHAHSVCTFMY